MQSVRDNDVAMLDPKMPGCRLRYGWTRVRPDAFLTWINVISEGLHLFSFLGQPAHLQAPSSEIFVTATNLRMAAAVLHEGAADKNTFE